MMNSQAQTPFRVSPLPHPARIIEKRKNRRSSVADALELVLSSAAAAGGLDVILIADDAGMLVSSSHTPLDLDMLAAITPIVSRGRAKANVKRNGDQRELSVKSIRVLDETLHIAALGGDSQGRALGVMRCVTAARRILG